MRTNIVLNDDLMREAGKYAAANTKRGLIEEALQVFIRTKAAEKRAENYRERLLRLEKTLAGLKLRESPSQVLREAREQS